MIIDNDTPKNPVTNASYDKQQVCAYVPLFSRWASQ